MTEEITTIKKKVDAYWVLGEEVHITYKKNNHWARGTIIQVKNDFFVLDENKEGKIPVLFEEIINIEKKRVKNE